MVCNKIVPVFTAEDLIFNLTDTAWDAITSFIAPVENRISTIEDTKVQVSKRKGVISFVRVFPVFSAAVENMITGLDTNLPVRRLVDHEYDRILRAMFESLKEADELLLTCVEEGIVYGTNADLYRSALNLYVISLVIAPSTPNLSYRLHTRAEGARFEAHAARTYAEDVANWFKGLSRRISEICWQVRDVRADISVSYHLCRGSRPLRLSPLYLNSSRTACESERDEQVYVKEPRQRQLVT